MIPYPITVRIAIINTVSIWIVLSIVIHSPYAPAGKETLKTELKRTIVAKISGAIDFLIVPKEKIIYTIIAISPNQRAYPAVDLIYFPTLGPTTACSIIS